MRRNMLVTGVLAALAMISSVAVPAAADPLPPLGGCPLGYVNVPAQGVNNQLCVYAGISQDGNARATISADPLLCLRIVLGNIRNIGVETVTAPCPAAAAPPETPILPQAPTPAVVAASLPVTH